MFNVTNIPPITKNLLIVNILLWIVTYVIPFQNMNLQGILQETLSAHLVSSDKFFPTQIITHMFMHAGPSPIHLFSNMIGLLIFGSTLERQIKPKQYFTLYFVSGLGAFLLQTLFFFYAPPNPNTILLGASGAIYGLLMAFAVIFPKTKMTLIFLPFFSLEARYFIPLLLAFDLFSGFSSNPWISGIAHFAHIGGAITGFLLMSYWKKNMYRWN